MKKQICRNCKFVKKVDHPVYHYRCDCPGIGHQVYTNYNSSCNAFEGVDQSVDHFDDQDIPLLDPT